MRHLLSGSAAALSLLASVAGAECLDSSDLTRGVVVRFENGDYTISRRQGDGYLGMEEHYANGGAPMYFRAHRGIYFVEEGEASPTGGTVAGTGLTIDFPTDPAILPEPLPGVSWEGQTVNLFDDGSTRDERVTIRYSEAPPITLSDCSYEAVRADIRYDWGDQGGLDLAYLYLPEVKTAMILSSQFDGDVMSETRPVGLERYTK
ncbi:hypothetical protein ACXN5S_04505 [Pseudoroseicyclus sp. H15]